MIFGEARVLLLSACTTGAFFLVPVRWRHAVLIVSGAVFYWWYAPPQFVGGVAGLIAMTFLLSGRLGVWLNALVLIGLLAYFKSAGAASAFTGALAGGASSGRILFPLGLSFLSFELIHVAIERRRGRIPRLTLQGLTAFALYFPCRLAGPIKRYQPFESSLQDARWSIGPCYDGLVRILWGALKKIVVADWLALVVAELNFPVTPMQAWKGIVAYSLYLFFDFSAYSDIAIGMSWILGLRVPENFRSPYLARNIREFWNRWHMSLSTWLRDYLFLPISRRLALKPCRLPARAAAVLGYLVTFTICGIWHGPSLNFLLWGLYHGLWLSGYALYTSFKGPVRRRAPPRDATWSLGAAASCAVTFSLVTLGWLLFAFPVPRAAELFQRLMGRSG